MILGQKINQGMLDIAAADNLPVLLVGETGTGKTSLIRELAAKHKKQYSRFSITGETTVDDFVGKYILKNGETVWQDGLLLTAAREGHYLVVDEINAALPEILFVLHSLLDDDKYITVPQKDNEVVTPHKDFRFFATMNPVDEYAGTKELNKAFHSRFAMVLCINYPGKDIEAQILQSRTTINELDARKMIDVALKVRRAKADDKLFYTLSTRDLLYWAMLTPKLGIHQAFKVSITNKSGEDAPMVEKLYTEVFSAYKAMGEAKVISMIDELKNMSKVLEKERAIMREQVDAELQEKYSTEREELDKMTELIKKQLAQSLKAAA